jgi:predicted TIM-barrel fold metal-dependent hydrolase
MATPKPAGAPTAAARARLRFAKGSESMKRLLPALAALGLVSPAAAVEAPLPIFDAHVHYSEPAWRAYPPEEVAKMLTAAGVARALVSSSPDDGTLMLHRLDGSRFVPILRPYRAGVGPANWTEAAGVVEYLDERLKSGAYLGIGEFHLAGAAAGRPAVKAVVERARARDIVLHVHSGAAEVRTLLAIDRRVKILWAHAGMSEPPAAIGALLGDHANVWTEVSFRAHDILRDGRVDPDWLALFRRFPDRFMVGTDTYVSERWASYGSLIAEHRAWLRLLPRDLAEAIAFRNAVRLFGSGGRKELE